MQGRWTLSFLLALALFQSGSSQATAGVADYQTPGLDGPEFSQPVFHQALRRKLTYPLGWSDQVRDAAAWRAAALAKARELILLGNDDRTPFAPRVIDEIDRGSYVARKLVFNLTAESRVLALLLVPKGRGPHPAVLALHDHGARFDIGKEKLIETWGDAPRLASSRQWAERYFSGRFPGDELARRGYVVLAVDALAWGERGAAGFERESQQALAANLFALGSSFASIIAQEDLRAAALLASLPEVDARRVAAFGFSNGAFRAWQVAGLSDHISACVASGWMLAMQGVTEPAPQLLRGQSAFSTLHVHLNRFLDHPDVAGLAAPKPMLVLHGELDPLFPLPAVRLAFDKMQRIWAGFGAAAKLETALLPGVGHSFDAAQQQRAFDWLDRQLQGAPRPAQGAAAATLK